MALTRAFLKGLGLTEEQQTAIIEAHTDTVTALKTQIDEKDNKIKETNEKLGKVNEYEQKIKEYKDKEKSNQSYKELYEKEHNDFESYKTKQESDALKTKKTEAFKGILRKANIAEKRFDGVVKISGDTIDGIKFDDKGQIENEKELLESVKNDFSDFISVKNEQGVKTGEPVGQGNNGKALTKDEIMEIKDTRKRQEAWKQYLMEKQNG